MVCKRHRNGGEAGYTLALVMVMASVLLVALSEAALNWQTAVKREREEELIFRGEQYQRALILWYAHWSRTLGTPQVAYPSTVEALLNTNNKRFLRQPWTDPITNEEWRFIKVGPNGRPLLTVLPGTAETGAGGDRNPYGSEGSGQSRESGTRAPAAAGQTAYGQTLKDPIREFSHHRRHRRRRQHQRGGIPQDLQRPQQAQRVGVLHRLRRAGRPSPAGSSRRQTRSVRPTGPGGSGARQARGTKPPLRPSRPIQASPRRQPRQPAQPGQSARRQPGQPPRPPLSAHTRR